MARLGLNAQHNLPALSELDGIAYKIDNYLAQAHYRGVTASS